MMTILTTLTNVMQTCSHGPSSASSHSSSSHLLLIIININIIIIILIVTITIIIIITRPRPAFGRLGLGRSSGGKTSGVSLCLASRLRRSARP